MVMGVDPLNGPSFLRAKLHPELLLAFRNVYKFADVPVTHIPAAKRTVDVLMAGGYAAECAQAACVLEPECSRHLTVGAGAGLGHPQTHICKDQLRECKGVTGG